MNSTFEAEWEALADRVGAPPFHRAGWFEIWLRTLGEGEPLVLETRRGGRLTGVLPLLQRGRELVSQTSWHSPSFTLLAEDEAARAELAALLFGRPETVVDLNLLAMEGAGGIEALAAAARGAGRRPVVRELIRTPYIELPGSFEDYEKTLSKSRRRNLRRRYRMLEEQGELSFEISDGGADLEARLAEMYAVEGGGWKSERGEAITSSVELESFFTEIAHWAADRGWLRLSFLRLDGVAIAAEYILEYGDTWYLVRTGYDEEYRSFGPGAALMAKEFEYLCDRPGIEKVDLLGETGSYKEGWATGSVPRHWLLAYRRSPGGIARWAETSLRKRVGSALRRRREKRADGAD